MTRFILNSAVITAPGLWRYDLISADQARVWLAEGEFTSTVRYADTAAALRELTGVHIPLNPTTIVMQPGDVALVFRLALPPGSARITDKDKGMLSIDYLRQHCEIGLLKRVG